MNLFGWILQVSLAIALGLQLAVKASSRTDLHWAIDELAGWSRELPSYLKKLSSAADILGILGLIIPGITGVYPNLTVWAAIGIMLLMLGAIVFHAQRKEYMHIVINIMLLWVAAIIMVIRWVLAPL